MQSPKKTKFTIRTINSIILATSLVGTASIAKAETHNWEYSIAPYLWGASLSGEAGTLPGVPPAEVDAGFSDILDNLQAGAMIVGNANNGRFGITLDLQYIDLEATSDQLEPLFSSVELGVTNRIISLSAEYLLSESQTHELWAAAGARHWYVDTNLDLSEGALPGTSVSGDDAWLDPMVGLRGAAYLDEDVYLTGWAYVGGFGVGSESMADVFAGIGYDITEVTAGVVGYRWLSVDRDEDDFLYDIEQQGFMFGLRFSL